MNKELLSFLMLGEILRGEFEKKSTPKMPKKLTDTERARKKRVDALLLGKAEEKRKRRRNR